MNTVAAALAQLQRALAQALMSPGKPQGAIIRLQIPFPLSNSDPLSWLSSQPIWPQFYWQQRKGNEELAALGAVISFPCLAEAQRYLQQPGIPGDLTLCGLNAFEPATGQLFLPRLLWQRQGASATLNLHWLAEEDPHQIAQWLAQLLPASPLAPLALSFTHETHRPDHRGWIALIEQATQAIADQALDKVVMARASDLFFAEAVNAAAMMAASRRVNLNCFHFYMAFSADNAFLGSTPERLWCRRGDALRTEALAGTVANDENDGKANRLGEWLMQDDKNQRENMLVVEDICQRLTPYVTSLEVMPPQVLRLRKVQHLRRCIWTVLSHPDDALCLERLQPTAAVAGLPRDKARAFIAAHEPFDREWYAGSAGYLCRDKAEFCVALRSAQVSGNRVRLYAGAGIVAGSSPEQEWQEIENKAAGLRTLLFGA